MAAAGHLRALRHHARGAFLDGRIARRKSNGVNVQLDPAIGVFLEEVLIGLPDLPAAAERSASVIAILAVFRPHIRDGPRVAVIERVDEFAGRLANGVAISLAIA